MQSEEFVAGSTITLDYTYHRHSAPKDVVYYRCSDKNCKARLHYNKRTKAITLKNEHLPADVHKRAKLNSVVAVEALPAMESCSPNDFKGGHTFTNGSDSFDELKCSEALPDARPNRTVRLLNGRSAQLATVSFCPDSIEAGMRVCEAAVTRGVAVNACLMEKGQRYGSKAGVLEAHDCSMRVCLEMDCCQLPALASFLQQELGYCPETDAYCISAEDFNVT